MATTNESTISTTKPETSDGMFTFSAPPPPQREIPEKALPFAQRRIKNALPVARPGDLKEKRRGQFLRKVEQSRNEDRWEKRGNDILRMDFMQRQREWAEAQARSAASIALEESMLEDEDEMDDAEDHVPGISDLPTFSSSGFSNQMQMSSQRPPGSSASRLEPQRNEEDEIDRLLRDEDDELEMLLSYMPTEEGEDRSGQGAQQQGEDGDSLWSDDADYDALFSEVLLSQEAQTQRAQEQQGGSMDTEMDMT